MGFGLSRTGKVTLPMDTKRKTALVFMLGVPLLGLSTLAFNTGPLPTQAEMLAEKCARARPSQTEIAKVRRQMEASLAQDVDGKRYNVDTMIEGVIQVSLPRECW